MFPDGSVIGKAGADGGDHRLFHKVNFTSLGPKRRVNHSTFFDLRDF
jgi:hypothetical protein